MNYGKYNEEKGREVLKYILSKGLHNKYHVMKAVYFADKYHLEHYGRQVNGNTYYALELGPVPSELYEFVKDIQKGTVPDFYARKYDLFCEDTYDRKWFSKSDMEALDFGINEVSGLTMGQVMDKSHDAAYLMTDENCIMSLESIISQMPNAGQLMEYLSR